jgi:hypothetical protein
MAAMPGCVGNAIQIEACGGIMRWMERPSQYPTLTLETLAGTNRNRPTPCKAISGPPQVRPSGVLGAASARSCEAESVPDR